MAATVQCKQLSLFFCVGCCADPYNFVVPSQQWVGLVEDAQKPILLSSRDGKLLRPVPAQRRLTHEKLARHMEAALTQREQLCCEARSMLCSAWAQGGRSHACISHRLVCGSHVIWHPVQTTWTCKMSRAGNLELGGPAEKTA